MKDSVYFQPNLDIKIPHRNWENALSQAFALLISASVDDVICITGPSRIGKSRLIKKLKQLLVGEDRFEETGYLPVVEVEAANSGMNGSFSTKSFIQRMLEAVRHPTLSIRERELDDKYFFTQVHVSEHKLRAALEMAFIARKTKYLFIDESQHVKYTTKKTDTPHAVMDSWKSLASECKLVLVIVGAYPVLDVLKKSPHMLGRKHQVHISRYHRVKADLECFQQILDYFNEAVKLAPDIKTLGDCNELLYSGSLGCIGLLKGWLYRASAFASIDGGGISIRILEQTVLPDYELQEIEKEILAGENILNNSHVKETGFMKDEKPKKIIRKNKPFKRNPKRYASGNRT